MQTLNRLLRKEQSDLGLHCLQGTNMPNLVSFRYIRSIIVKQSALLLNFTTYLALLSDSVPELRCEDST